MTIIKLCHSKCVYGLNRGSHEKEMHIVSNTLAASKGSSKTSVVSLSQKHIISLLSSGWFQERAIRAWLTKAALSVS